MGALPLPDIVDIIYVILVLWGITQLFCDIMNNIFRLQSSFDALCLFCNDKVSLLFASDLLASAFKYHYYLKYTSNVQQR